MINDFIRNLGFVFLRRFTHHKRVEHYYLSLVCTLATRLSTSVILRLVSSFYLRRGSNSQSSDSYSEAFPLSYEGMLGVRWVSIPLPLESQSSTLPIELQTPYKSRIVVSNHSKVGYEPTLIPDHTGVAEDIGIEPNTRRYISLSRRTLSPSRFIFRSAHNRTRTYNLRRIRSALSPIELYERLRTR